MNYEKVIKWVLGILLAAFAGAFVQSLFEQPVIILGSIQEYAAWFVAAYMSIIAVLILRKVRMVQEHEKNIQQDINKKIERVTRRREALQRVQRDLKLEKGYYSNDGFKFKVRPTRPEEDWLEFVFEIENSVRCPQCRKRMEPQQDKMLCTNKQCGVKVSESRSPHMIWESACNAFQIEVEDWIEQNPDCGQMRVVGNPLPNLAEITHEYDVDKY
jgi:hypothetical protein